MRIYEISDLVIDAIELKRCAALKTALESEAARGLSLAGVRITTDNIELYCQALALLRPNSLRFLDISRCTLSDELLARLLPIINALGITRLKVSTNHLTTTGYQCLFAPEGSVKDLILSHCALNDSNFPQLIPSIVACKRLTALDLRDNHLSDNSFSLLAEQLCALRLSDLRLKGNLPTLKTLYHFAEKLVQAALHTGLVSIDLLEMRDDAKMRLLCENFVNAKLEPMCALVHAFEHFSLTHNSVAASSESMSAPTHKRRFSQ